jgi:hypothetical protein
MGRLCLHRSRRALALLQDTCRLKPDKRPRRQCRGGPRRSKPNRLTDSSGADGDSCRGRRSRPARKQRGSQPAEVTWRHARATRHMRSLTTGTIGVRLHSALPRSSSRSQRLCLRCRQETVALGQSPRRQRNGNSRDTQEAQRGGPVTVLRPLCYFCGIFFALAIMCGAPRARRAQR